MSQEQKTTQRLLTALMRCRTECLTTFVTHTYGEGSPFLRDDRLIMQVRGGTIFDAVCDYVRHNDVGKFTSFLEETTQHLINADYSFDNIKMLYTELGQSMLTVVRREMQRDPDLDSALRNINYALQLVHMIALNQSSIRLIQRMSERDKSNGRVPNGSTYAPPPATFGTQPATSNFRSMPTDFVTGYLTWPLVAVPNTRPVEYRAVLEDGTPVQALLVDDPDFYPPYGNLARGMIRCRLRQIGPVVFAYPMRQRV